MSENVDVRLIEKLIRTPGWTMPENLLSTLPQALYQIIQATFPEEHPDEAKRGKPIYAARTRLSAARVLIAMKGQNDAQAPKAPLDVNVRVDGDFAASLKIVAELTREEREALAATAPVHAKLDRIAQAERERLKPSNN